MAEPEDFLGGVNRLTERRIKGVMKYVVHCYLKMLSDKTIYRFSDRGRLTQEDFLTNGLISDYLSKSSNKEYYRDQISDNPFVDIYFSPEEAHRYSDNSGLSDDFIDISVKETGLSKALSGETDDEIKFAIECKRINVDADYSKYMGDIKKMADRPYRTYRLPFEGQIAFIENSDLTPEIVSEEVNTKLRKSKTIITTQYLASINLHKSFDGSCYSKHKRNHGMKQEFTIYHLMFDYSDLVTA